MNKTYDSYLGLLKKEVSGVKFEEYGRSSGYPLVVFSTPPQKRTVVISSGFHGDEPMGPMTFVKHGKLLVDMAKGLEVCLRVYPCTNPSGWANSKRYALQSRKPTNDAIEYLIDGEWRGNLEDGESFTEWRLKGSLSPEMRAFADHVTNHQPANAFLDIHQDGCVKRPGFYAYVYGKSSFRHLVRASSKFATVIKDTEVDKSARDRGQRFKTDENGLVDYHDGSSQDLLFRLGAKYAATLETTLELSLERVMGVNLVWAMGFIELASRSES